jgi:uncharacterized cupredoxin-like copper-binding protein
LGALPVVFTVLLACGERAPADTSDAPSTPPSRPSIVADGAIGSLALPDAGQEATTLELGTIGNKMSYTAEVLEAPAGLIRVRFTNHADLGALQHNVVIVRWGDREAIGRAALTAGEAKRLVPDDVRVLAATKRLGPAETGALLVRLEAGEYEFFCSYHGHYLMMKGTLTVR